jgi:UDP-glucose:glycoprotein glucosyltransferase
MAILYLDPDSTSNAELLNYLTYHTNTYPTFGFTVRYRPKRSTAKRTVLSGYGVELALKNTDYLVVDDRVSTPKTTAAGNGTTAGHSQGQGGFFAEVLGDDPWAELLTPLSTLELRGKPPGCSQR